MQNNYYVMKEKKEKSKLNDDEIVSDKPTEIEPSDKINGEGGEGKKVSKLPGIQAGRAVSAPAGDEKVESRRRRIYKTPEERRWEREYTILQDRVDKAKPMVDCQPPKFLLRTMLNQKKYQVEQAKAKWIERENRQLLERIGRILQTRGQVDHRNETYERLKRNERILGNPYRNQRHAELVKITMQNQHFLRLLLSVGPRMPTHELMKDWERNCKTMAFTSKRDPERYKEMRKDAHKAMKSHKERLTGLPRLQSHANE